MESRVLKVLSPRQVQCHKDRGIKTSAKTKTVRNAFKNLNEKETKEKKVAQRSFSRTWTIELFYSSSRMRAINVCISTQSEIVAICRSLPHVWDEFYYTFRSSIKLMNLLMDFGQQIYFCWVSQFTNINNVVHQFGKTHSITISNKPKSLSNMPRTALLRFIFSTRVFFLTEWEADDKSWKLQIETLFPANFDDNIR